MIHAERALTNLTEGTRGLVFSQSVLLALVAVGNHPRRRLPHRPARRRGGRRPRGGHLREVLAADPEVTLDDGELDAAFDLERALAPPPAGSSRPSSGIDTAGRDPGAP